MYYNIIHSSYILETSSSSVTNCSNLMGFQYPLSLSSPFLKEHLIIVDFFVCSEQHVSLLAKTKLSNLNLQTFIPNINSINRIAGNFRGEIFSWFSIIKFIRGKKFVVYSSVLSQLNHKIKSSTFVVLFKPRKPRKLIFPSEISRYTVCDYFLAYQNTTITFPINKHNNNNYYVQNKSSEYLMKIASQRTTSLSVPKHLTLENAA